MLFEKSPLLHPAVSLFMIQQKKPTEAGGHYGSRLWVLTSGLFPLRNPRTLFVHDAEKISESPRSRYNLKLCRRNCSRYSAKRTPGRLKNSKVLGYKCNRDRKIKQESVNYLWIFMCASTTHFHVHTYCSCPSRPWCYVNVHLITTVPLYRRRLVVCLPSSPTSQPARVPRGLQVVQKRNVVYDKPRAVRNVWRQCSATTSQSKSIFECLPCTPASGWKKLIDDDWHRRLHFTSDMVIAASSWFQRERAAATRGWLLEQRSHEGERAYGFCLVWFMTNFVINLVLTFSYEFFGYQQIDGEHGNKSILFVKSCEVTLRGDSLIFETSFFFNLCNRLKY